MSSEYIILFASINANQKIVNVNQKIELAQGIILEVELVCLNSIGRNAVVLLTIMLHDFKLYINGLK